MCSSPRPIPCRDAPRSRSRISQTIRTSPTSRGDFNSFYFSEEPPSTLGRPKNIRVRDRATLFNLLIGLDGYTVCSGVISHELNGEDIIAVPLEVDDRMEVGIVTRRDTHLSRYGKAFIEAIRTHIP